MTHILLAGILLLLPGLWPEDAPQALTPYLDQFNQKNLAFEARLSRLLDEALGTPYADGPLGEGPQGVYDQDPLMDLRRVDCVTFVEEAIALAASNSYEQAFSLLQAIRYADGKIDFEHRNHFLIADWLEENTWCRPCSHQLEAATASLTRTISKKDFFRLVKAPELGQSIPDRTITLAYLPHAEAPKAISSIKAPTLIVFIGKKPDWLFALHTGIYLPQEAGQGKLYHASSKAGKVVAVDLLAYLKSQEERYLGIAVYTIGDPQAEKR